MPLKKRRGRVCFSPAMARRKLSSDWAENLADSNKGLILRPEAIAEGVYEQTSTECDPSVSTSTFSARRSTENYG